MQCLLVAKPGNARTSIKARRPTSDAGIQSGTTSAMAAAQTATFEVTYIGFTNAPAAQAAFQRAVDIWSSLISSPQPIRVRAEFAAMSPNILGGASASTMWRDFPGAPQSGTWYADALADRTGGADRQPGAFDILATFNSARGDWYFGVDGNTPDGRYDFVSVVLHELTHGLGFFGVGHVDASGAGTLGYTGFPTAYDRMTVTEAGAPMLNFQSPSMPLGSQLRREFVVSDPRGPGVYFAGPQGSAANNNQTARLYTPSTWTDGSSYSHFEEETYPEGTPNSLMTHALAAAEAIHDPGSLVLAVLSDLGWEASSPSDPGTLSASPAALRFAGANNNGTLETMTPPQKVRVGFGGGAATWYVNSSAAWLHVNGGNGAGDGEFTVSIANPGNVIGTQSQLSATLTVIAQGAANSPLTIPVELSMFAPGGGAAPIGQVDTPFQNASGVVGAISITGWAVDDVAVQTVKIYRNCLPFDAPASCVTVLGANVVFVGDAQMLAGARPDVESAFPNMPRAYMAGWGAQVLSNTLPHVPNSQPFGGQGTLQFHVIATDVEGHMIRLGRGGGDQSPTVVTMNNDAIAKPFGTLDTPTLGGTVSGITPVFGWALTPDDGTGIEIPTNGSSMVVYIDGVAVGTVAFNQCRGNVGNPPPAGTFCNDDIANIFGQSTPQAPLSARSANPSRFRNLDAGRGAIGAFNMNTFGLSNGLHTIAWSVTDNRGRVEGIGSRFFTVLNSGGGSVQSASLAQLLSAPAESRGDASTVEQKRASARGVAARTGFDPKQPMQQLKTDAGSRTIEVEVGDRVELGLASAVDAGYLVVNGQLRDLPVGSTLDRRTGVFAWTPAAGYLGTYRLSFVTGQERVDVVVRIVPARGAARLEKIKSGK